VENPSGTCIYVETIMQVALTGASVSHKICVHKTVTVIDLLFVVVTLHRSSYL